MDIQGKHHDELVNRGYQLLGKPRNMEYLQAVGGNIPPVFAYGDDAYSIAFDELGCMYLGGGHVSLADLGFEENEARLNEVCDSLGYKF